MVADCCPFAITNSKNPNTGNRTHQQLRDQMPHDAYLLRCSVRCLFLVLGHHVSCNGQEHAKLLHNRKAAWRPNQSLSSRLHQESLDSSSELQGFGRELRANTRCLDFMLMRVGLFHAFGQAAENVWHECLQYLGWGQVLRTFALDAVLPGCN